ncbi:LMBR1-like membrane protein [Glomus cerebriforme]|uniref:LMBR1-like membrane protein n=1 Tax=Glomus cerebriforme TaxID=658196 RepID=A0A397TGP2_9GLOM|nr:LMBR1-like membrane protein [Glomus cerebriforme]
MTSIEENSTLNASEKAANEFYNWVRQNIIAFLLFVSLYSISYSLLKRFRRKNRISDAEEEDDDLYGIDNLIIIILCAGGLAMALAGFLLWPFTMIATALLHNELFSGNYYLTWLNAELLVTLWNYAFIGCNIALFALLPFAFFYSETDQFRTFFAKARETLTIMVLVGMLMYGCIYTLKMILGMSDVDELEMLNLFTCIGGALICLKATPRGYIEIFSWISRLPLRPDYRRSLKEKMIRNKMDITVWRQRLENLDRGLRSVYGINNTSRSAVLYPSAPSQRSYSSSKLYASMCGLTNNIMPTRSGNLSNSRNEIIVKINKLEEERERIQQDLSHSPLYRNISFLVLLLVSNSIWLLVLGHILYTLMKSLLVDDEKDLKNLEALIGKQTVSIFGRFGTLKDIMLMFYFTSATIIGVYSISPFKRIRPRLGRMTVQHMIANVTVLLVISSSWPALVRVLGLTRLGSAGPYENFSTMTNIGQYLAMAFRFGSLITTVFSTLEYYVLRNLIRYPSHASAANEITHQPYNNERFYQPQRNGNMDEANLNRYYFHHSPPDHHGMRR